MRVIGVLALGLAVGAVAASASGRPALRVMSLRPLTVHGYRFEPREHLRIVIMAKRRVERTLDTSRRGTFTLKVRGLSLGRCAQYSVQAYAPSGLRAGVKSPPASCGAQLGP